MPSISDLVLKELSPRLVPNLLSQFSFVSSTSENKIILNLRNKTITSSSNVELIQLSVNTDSHSDFVIKIPYTYDRILINLTDTIDLSNNALKCNLTSKKISSSFQIDALDIKLPLNNHYTDLVSFTMAYENKDILDFIFYREPPDSFSSKDSQPSTNKISDTNHLSVKKSSSNSDTKKSSFANENPFPIPMPDGPLFRESINVYEQLAPSILNQLLYSMDKINGLDQSVKNLDNAKLSLLNTLKEFKSEYLRLVPTGDLVYSKFDHNNDTFNTNQANDFLKALRHSTAETKIDFVALKSLQNFNSSKKNFEDESKKFYDWLSKLMGSGKSKDEKLLLKMKNFEIIKMEYFNFLYDTVTPMLLVLLQPNSLLSKQYWSNRPMREQAIKDMQNCTSMEEFSYLMSKYSIAKPSQRSLLLVDPNSSYKFDGAHLKTGLLFVFGGKGKSGWHKQWLVLRNGKLYEYMDWRKGAELRNDPIDVSLCNIKMLDSNDHRQNNIDIGSRKNCFRVINAQGVEHVFQAFTPEGANEWVKALFEAGQMIAFNKQKSTERLPKLNPNSSGLKQIRDMNNSNSSVRKNSKGHAYPRMRRVSSVSTSLLHVVQRADPANIHCADCGSKEQVEWISLNLLVIFCIRCSSAHRALGTSVSKVRSLMLDSFAGEHRVLVHHISNSSINSVYEAKLQKSEKPTPECSNEKRLEFITNKYSKKLYVSDLNKQDAQHILLEGVRDDCVSKVIEGIAGGADVNKKIIYHTDSAESSSIVSENDDTKNNIEISYLEYALLHPSILDGNEVFDVAELLVLNGCDVGTQIRPDCLIDSRATKWWQERIDRINGSGSVSVKKENQSISTSSQSYNSNTPVAPLKKQTFGINPRRSLSGNRPLISTNTQNKKFFTSGSKNKIKSPKEGFNLFKKKIKNLE